MPLTAGDLSSLITPMPQIRGTEVLSRGIESLGKAAEMIQRNREQQRQDRSRSRGYDIAEKRLSETQRANVEREQGLALQRGELARRNKKLDDFEKARQFQQRREHASEIYEDVIKHLASEDPTHAIARLRLAGVIVRNVEEAQDWADGAQEALVDSESAAIMATEARKNLLENYHPDDLQAMRAGLGEGGVPQPEPYAEGEAGPDELINAVPTGQGTAGLMPAPQAAEPQEEWQGELPMTAMTPELHEAAQRVVAMSGGEMPHEIAVGKVLQASQGAAANGLPPDMQESADRVIAIMQGQIPDLGPTPGAMGTHEPLPEADAPLPPFGHESWDTVPVMDLGTDAPGGNLFGYEVPGGMTREQEMDYDAENAPDWATRPIPYPDAEPEAGASGPSYALSFEGEPLGMFNPGGDRNANKAKARTFFEQLIIGAPPSHMAAIEQMRGSFQSLADMVGQEEALKIAIPYMGKRVSAIEQRQRTALGTADRDYLRELKRMESEVNLQLKTARLGYMGEKNTREQEKAGREKEKLAMEADERIHKLSDSFGRQASYNAMHMLTRAANLLSDEDGIKANGVTMKSAVIAMGTAEQGKRFSDMDYKLALGYTHIGQLIDRAWAKATRGELDETTIANLQGEIAKGIIAQQERIADGYQRMKLYYDQLTDESHPALRGGVRRKMDSLYRGWIGKKGMEIKWWGDSADPDDVRKSENAAAGARMDELLQMRGR